ncbi:glutamate-gated kainate-type ion channel receptor subunit GluR5 [Corchorus capsularis]|uniref:Glutamate-gated kainate-type ion channel receptor subunit GluR5 n=1 Tax=Corchorus capsularis TaxID=210143 RepID=A0A1R3KFT7_COCAP|nr:glutamate-gated kainate-type ion channel receptor subunit GluR5 [Corchorus capsularis]
MALSDFYETHTSYRTRLVLNSRDSKVDVVGAAAAATLRSLEAWATRTPPML